MVSRICITCNSPLAPADRFCRACGAPHPASAVQERTHWGVDENRRVRLRARIPLRVLTAIGVILLFLVGAVLVFQPENSAQSSYIPPDDVHDASGVPYPEVPRLSVSDAKAKYDARTALFVDVRSPGEYDAAHIPEATLLPLAELPARYRDLPRGGEIVTYCT